jgi:uncharacterized protein (DUF885 family)
MNRSQPLILRLGAVVLLAAAACAAQAASGFAEWSERFAADWVRQSAERATMSQLLGSEEQATLERELTPLTRARREREQALAREGLLRLATFKDGDLTPDERIGAGILRWQLQRTIDGAPYADHNFAFNQLGGPHLRFINLLAEQQPLRRPADVDAFLSRLSQVGARLDEAVALSRAATGRGLLPPRFILERAQTQVRAFLAQGEGSNDIVQGFAHRSERIEGLAAARREEALREATRLVRESVRPAMERVAAYLDELHPKTTADAGLWRLPDGEKAYAQALANFTTTSMSAAQIHALGLREVARIEAEMDGLLKRLGKSEGSVNARLAALNAELQPPAGPDAPDPRPGLIARYTAAVRDAEKRAEALFNLKPSAPVDVRRVPTLTERTASAHYTAPAPDGSRPGIFWAPLPGPLFGVLGIRTLAVHEAVPGHHFQIALQQEQAQLPRWRQRRIFGGGSAHSEGWALYAERLAIEEGWYADDPHALLGAWGAQLFRARRLVVDTGLHTLRWSRQQAIDYGISASEVERYVANPGQATAYMVGMLHIMALRDEARARLGPRFSLKAFHDVVLKTGSVPLDLLSTVVRSWIEEQRV